MAFTTSGRNWNFGAQPKLKTDHSRLTRMTNRVVNKALLPSQKTRGSSRYSDLAGQTPFLLLHPTVAHRLALARVRAHLRPVDRQLPEPRKVQLESQTDHAGPICTPASTSSRDNVSTSSMNRGRSKSSALKSAPAPVITAVIIIGIVSIATDRRTAIRSTAPVLSCVTWFVVRANSSISRWCEGNSQSGRDPSKNNNRPNR